MDAIEAESNQTHAWYKLWWDVWTLPGTDSFRTILAEPNGGMARGFLWTLVTGLIYGTFYVIFQMAFPNNTPTANLPPETVAAIKSIGSLTSFICIPIASVIGIIISAGIYHGIARLVGGNGEWGRLLFCFAAIQGPQILITMLLSAPTSILSQTGTTFGWMMMVFALLGNLALSIYSFVLYIFAIKAAEGLSGGKAFLVLFLPSLLIVGAFACLFGGAVATYLSQMH